MKKLLLTSLVIVLLAGSVFGGCAKSETTVTETQTTSVETQTTSVETQTTPTEIPLLHGTGPTVWSTYAITVATDDLINRETNLNITVRGYDGSEAAFTALVEGIVDLTFGGSDIVGQAFHGVLDWESFGPQRDVRVLIPYMALYKTWAVTAASGITSIADLEGDKVTWLTAQGPTDEFERVLEAYGLDPDTDIIKVQVPGPDDAMEEMRMGRADTWWSDLKKGADILELVESVGKLYALPIEPDVVQELIEQYPMVYLGFYPINLPEQEHLANTGDTPVMGQAFYMVTRDQKLVRFYLPLEPDDPQEPVWSVVRKLSDRIGEQLTTHLRDIAGSNPLLEGIIDRSDFAVLLWRVNTPFCCGE